jgi:predicted transcriptional regulator
MNERLEFLEILESLHPELTPNHYNILNFMYEKYNIHEIRISDLIPIVNLSRNIIKKKLDDLIKREIVESYTYKNKTFYKLLDQSYDLFVGPQTDVSEEYGSLCSNIYTNINNTKVINVDTTLKIRRLFNILTKNILNIDPDYKMFLGRIFKVANNVVCYSKCNFNVLTDLLTVTWEKNDSRIILRFGNDTLEFQSFMRNKSIKSILHKDLKNFNFYSLLQSWNNEYVIKLDKRIHML